MIILIGSYIMGGGMTAMRDSHSPQRRMHPKTQGRRTGLAIFAETSNEFYRSGRFQ
jgi:hypothetical protein